MEGEEIKSMEGKINSDDELVCTRWSYDTKWYHVCRMVCTEGNFKGIPYGMFMGANVCAMCDTPFDDESVERKTLSFFFLFFSHQRSLLSLNVLPASPLRPNIFQFWQ